MMIFDIHATLFYLVSHRKRNVLQFFSALITLTLYSYNFAILHIHCVCVCVCESVALETL